MAVYAIGDIQGCYQTFRKLLDRIRFDPSRDTLWLTGDLVNRGPRSLEVLRWCYRHRDSLVSVMGNHDLRLLACAASTAPLRRRDTFQDVLQAVGRDELLDWLRRRPLLHHDGRFVLVHAGLLPSWTLEEATRYAGELETVLRGHGYEQVLNALFAEEKAAGLFEPYATRWNDGLTGSQRWRALASIFTWMRVCTPAGVPDYAYRGAPEDAPQNLVPWFAVPGRPTAGKTILFGHWAALGFHLAPGAVGLDSGCIWGGPLTAVRLPGLELFQEPLADCSKRG